MQAYEANFDGLVGPTHNYAGLSAGNVASTLNAKDISNPQKAALQGLDKAKALSDLGLVQGMLAPHARPDFAVLRRLGFTGSDSQVIEKAARQAPEILASCYSASAMWTANAGTVSPSADTEDGKVHITPASLNNRFHRSIEPELTGRILKRTFVDQKYFHHHQHLPECDHFGDEGAANHTRFCTEFGDKGVEFFVFGKYTFLKGKPQPTKFPARQTYEASQAIARLHGLDPNKTVLAQQNPEVIDAGVFHNDVISVGNKNVYLYHEQALLNSAKVTEEIQKKFGSNDFHLIQVPEAKVSVADAVTSYLFNSQLISLQGGDMAIVVPEECRSNTAVWSYLQELKTLGTPIKQIKVFDVKESMKNGGGPACLRLRVVMTEQELQGVNPKTLMSDQLFAELNAWVKKHYRDRLSASDLADPNFAVEVQTAMDELTQILDLGSVYSFQQ